MINNTKKFFVSISRHLKLYKKV